MIVTSLSILEIENTTGKLNLFEFFVVDFSNDKRDCSNVVY